MACLEKIVCFFFFFLNLIRKGLWPSEQSPPEVARLQTEGGHIFRTYPLVIVVEHRIERDLNSMDTAIESCHRRDSEVLHVSGESMAVNSIHSKTVSKQP
jgi:hypothetical protein